MPDSKLGFLARIAGIVVNYINSKLFPPTTQEPSTQTDAKQVSEKKALLPQPAPPISPELQKKIDALERVSFRTALSFKAAQDEINEDALSAKSTPRASPRRPEKTLTSTTSAKQPNTEKLPEGRVQLNPTEGKRIPPPKKQKAPDKYWNYQEPSSNTAKIYSAVGKSPIGGYDKEQENLSLTERLYNIINPWDPYVNPTDGKAEPKPPIPLSPENFNAQSARTHIHYPTTSKSALEPAKESKKTNPTKLIRPQTMEARALTPVQASESKGQNQPGKEGGGVKFALAPKTGGGEIKAKEPEAKRKVCFAKDAKKGSKHNLKVPRTKKAGQAVPYQR